MAQPRLNLKNVTTLLVDSDPFTRGLVAHMLRGFGMDSPTQCETGSQARHYLENHYADLCIFEAAQPDMPGTELIKWVRRQENSPFRFVPIIVMSGYTQLRLISTARDSGANIVIKKPISPQNIFDRIMWAARTTRPFLDAGEYVGPDRRFKTVAPPNGQYRRQSDRAAPRGGAVENLQRTNAAAERS
ncbi:MAG TPA: response regulator [Rhizomicrobium sp.]